ncbi:hypothetical protein Enr13x_37650 [Stieleria neptunia]|uniref:Uncharacterized protein n=2 Tax=Stieleria neptunia TaxID=2527979 RepID=A0A518HST3_9BACT|nr:hypothetical protein Enr13x_37650 [Stieleria neptunia]
MACRKSKREQAEKLSFRLAPRYAEKVFEAATAAGISPNQFGRIATMIVAQNGLLGLNQEIHRVREELSDFRRELDDVIFEDEGG